MLQTKCHGHGRKHPTRPSRLTRLDSYVLQLTQVGLPSIAHACKLFNALFAFQE